MSFNIVDIVNGKYNVNTTKLFDAFHYLDPQKTNSHTISDSANASLNCFLRNANEAFKSKKPLIINEQVIRNKSEPLNWISTHGTPEFQDDMKNRFYKILEYAPAAENPNEAKE